MVSKKYSKKILEFGKRNSMDIENLDYDKLKEEIILLIRNIRLNSSELIKEKMELSYALRKEKEFREENSINKTKQKEQTNQNMEEKGSVMTMRM